MQCPINFQNIYFGIPILTSLSGSVSEILNEENWNTIPSDSNDLYDKILYLFNNESL